MDNCINCGFCEIEPPATSYGSWLACCTDPDKPLHGRRRVVGASSWEPFCVTPPVWCQREETAKKEPPSVKQTEGGGAENAKKNNKSCMDSIPCGAGIDKENSI